MEKFASDNDSTSRVSVLTRRHLESGIAWNVVADDNPFAFGPASIKAICSPLCSFARRLGGFLLDG